MSTTIVTTTGSGDLDARLSTNSTHDTDRANHTGTQAMTTVTSGNTSDGVSVTSSTILSAAQKTALTTGVSASGQHTHAASDIVSGIIAPARLGTGTADATTVLYGNGTYAAPPGASGTGEVNTLVLETGETGGVSPVGTKTGTALGIYGVAGASTRITAARDTTNKNVTIEANIGTTSGTLAAGDDSRFVDGTNLAVHSIASQAIGDILAADSTTTLARVAGNTTTTKKFLTQTGSGTASVAPSWNTIVSGDLPTAGVAQGGTGITSFTAGDILYATASTTLAKLAKGTSGQFLKQGASTPGWNNITAADVAAGTFPSGTFIVPSGATLQIASGATLSAVSGSTVSYRTPSFSAGNTGTSIVFTYTDARPLQYATATGNFVATVGAGMSDGDGMEVMIDTGAGGFTGSFAASAGLTLKMPTFTLTATAGKTDRFYFRLRGTTLFGSVIGQGI